MSDHVYARNGTASGIVTIILANITTTDAAKTIVLAALGAVVSFGVTWLLKSILKKPPDV